MDFEAVLHRVVRGVAYGFAAFVGLYLAAAPIKAAVAIVAVVAILQLLNVLTYWASITTGLLVVWGGLAAASVVPGAPGISPLFDQLVDNVKSAREKNGPTGAQAAQNVTPLSQKLEDLKLACDKKLLSSDECASQRAKILDN